MQQFRGWPLLWVAGTLAAQNPAPEPILKLLPADAKTIETADVGAAAGKPRMLVLWMVHPSKHVRAPGEWYCGDAVFGDYLEGPTSLSLVNPTEHVSIDTIRVEDDFKLPFFVRNGYYHVPHPNADKEGSPRILYLRDLTGEGGATQFVLFTYEACGIAGSSVFGYSKTADRAVQYAVEIHAASEKPRVETWIDQVFAHEPERPGHWDFTWSPGHGSDDIIHETVWFDAARQVFVEKQTVTSKP